MNLSVGVVFRILTLGDKALIGLLTLFSLVSLGLFYRGKRPGQAVIISVEGKEILRKELSENKSFDVHGVKGSMTLSIEHGSIRVIASSCSQSLCVRQGRIRETGQLIVCVPNKLTLTIDGERKNKFDAITG